MFSLAYPLTDSVEINGKTYPVYLSFDNVLRLIDMLNDQDLDDATQVELGVQMLTGIEIDCSLQQKSEILNELFQQLIANGENKTQSVDIEGNPMPSMEDASEEVYSLVEDAEYIYASFMQDYGMDLFEYQGKLHWAKFRALLSGLRDDTKFKKVLEIRQMEVPTGKGTEKERKAVIEAKKAYALNGQEIDEDDADEEY
ncbi:Bacteriophage Gp15 protein [Lysinibacillus sphaericus]|nr:Bacteriophage Gp15 protein [Lysinibacillus sphaericus]